LDARYRTKTNKTKQKQNKTKTQHRIWEKDEQHELIRQLVVKPRAHEK
jgi:hypothetical protein